MERADQAFDTLMNMSGERTTPGPVMRDGTDNQHPGVQTMAPRSRATVDIHIVRQYVPLLVALSIAASLAVADHMRPRDRTTDEGLSRATEIMKRVFADPNALTPKIHAEYWALVDKSGPDAEANMTQIRDKLTFLALVYDRHFFEDALISLRTGKPSKSAARQADENRLIADGTKSVSDIGNSDLFMAKIARREPVTKDGQTVVFDAAIINASLNMLDGESRRMETLLTRP